MGRFMRTGVVCVLAAGLVACTTPEPDLTPVSTTASAPWACDGVPLRGIEQASGTTDLEIDERGSWSPTRDFRCWTSSEDGEQILDVNFAFNISLANDAYLAEIAGGDSTIVLDGGDTPGRGYAYLVGGGPDAAAIWVVDQMALTVTLKHPAGGDRDLVDDVGNLLVSMLPWAFGGEDVPVA